MMILSLIKAHALLHQVSRKKTKDGFILATTDDYEVVRDLIHDFLGYALETTVPQRLREVVTAVVHI